MSDKNKLIWFIEFYTKSESSSLEEIYGIFIDKYYNDKKIIKETDGIGLEGFYYNKKEGIKKFGLLNNEKQYYFDPNNGLFKTNNNEYKLYFIYNSKDINITDYEYADYRNKIIFNRFHQIIDSDFKEKGCEFGYNVNLKYKEFDYKSIKMDVLYLVDNDDSEYFKINIKSSFDIKYLKLIIEDNKNKNNSYSKILTLNKDELNHYVFELKQKEELK